jgi:hypothetical protein
MLKNRWTAWGGLVAIAFAGCSNDEGEFHRWRQAQIDRLQQQAQENSAASRALVEADAESRKQFVLLEQTLEQQRSQVLAGHEALEQDRRSLAAARERIPLLAAALEGSVTAALIVVTFWLCGRLLLPETDGAVAGELEEQLLLSVAGESYLLTAPDASPRLAAEESPSPSPPESIA